MSHNSTAKVDQKEYLKKYLTADKSKKKKKKKDKDKEKKSKKSDTKLHIIDDDVTAYEGDRNTDDELLLYGEDAPQIVGEYLEVKPNGDADSKWRSIAEKEKEETDVKLETDGDRWGKKSSAKIKNEKYETKIKREITPDMSPARRRKPSRSLSLDKERTKLRSEDRKRKGNLSDQSPPRQRRQKMDTDDLSPPRNRKNGVSPHSRHLTGSRDQSPRRKFKNSMSPKHRNETNEQSRQQRKSEDLSPARKRKNSLSPRRRGVDIPRSHRKESKDISPSRKQRHSLSPRRPNEFSDQSPLGRRRRSIDQSPIRRRQFSPSKQQKNRFSPNFPQEPRRNKDSAGMSPFRRHRNGTPSKFQRRDFADGSPKRRGISPQLQNEYSRIERSPAKFPLRSRSGDRGRNCNPQRQNNYSNPFTGKRISHDNEMNLQGKRQMNSPRRRDDFNRKQSPIRERYRRDLGGNNRRDNSIGQRDMSDQSSPQRRQNRRVMSPISRRSPMPPPKATIHWETAAMVAQRKALNRTSASVSPPPTHKSKATKTLDGKKAGLQDARALKEETATRRRDEEKMYAKMSNELSGRDAEVQIRSTGRRGRQARDAEAEDPEKRRHKEEREQQRKDQYDRWGKGLKQIEDHRARIADQEYESSKPLARYADDEDLDRHLRERERAEDPMLDYMRRKRKDTDKKTNSKHKVPVYEGSYPENRFGIKPGHRWDGVDRSNGYEKKWFDVQNAKRAKQEDAYKYSVEDM